MSLVLALTKGEKENCLPAGSFKSVVLFRHSHVPHWDKPPRFQKCVAKEDRPLLDAEV